jgi:multiple sugar transport system substrate-binding protein
MIRVSEASVVADVTGFSILPGSDDVWNHAAGLWEELPEGPNHAPNLAYLGWGIYVMARVDGDALRHKAAWSAAAHLGGKDLSMWTVAYPSGFQPYRRSHFNIDEWEAAGYERDFIEDYLGSNRDSYDHPNAAIEPRVPGIFRYYSAAEEELARVYAGAFTAQQGADNIAAAWERITDDIGRDRQIAYYRASLGLG